MAIHVVPVVPKFENHNNQRVQVGHEMLEQTPYGLDYKSANAGDTFKLHSYDKTAGGVWEDAVPFKATLEIGRSLYKGKVEVIDRVNDRFYLMMTDDFVTAAKSVDFHQGKFSGTFEFVKKGTAFGIKLV